MFSEKGRMWLFFALNGFNIGVKISCGNHYALRTIPRASSLIYPTTSCQEWAGNGLAVPLLKSHRQEIDSCDLQLGGASRPLGEHRMQNK